MFEYNERKGVKLSIRISERDKERLDEMVKKYRLSQGEIMIRAFRHAYEEEKEAEKQFE